MDPVIRQIEAHAVEEFHTAVAAVSESEDAHAQHVKASGERDRIFCELVNRYGFDEARELLGLSS